MGSIRLPKPKWTRGAQRKTLSTFFCLSILLANQSQKTIKFGVAVVTFRKWHHNPSKNK